MKPRLGALLALIVLLLAGACQPKPPPPYGDATVPGPDGIEGDY